MEHHRVVGGAGEQGLVDLEAGEGAQPGLALRLLAHRRPHIGVDGVDARDRLERIGGHHQAAPEGTHQRSTSGGGRPVARAGDATLVGMPDIEATSARDRQTLLASPM